MLEIGSKGEYGARAMVFLAKRYGRGASSLTAISEEQHIPRRYLEQLISQLRNGGFVRATRGASGGYELAKKPSEINLYDIVAQLEGPLQLADCVHYNGRLGCSLVEECPVRDVLVSLHRMIHQSLNAITLEQLVEQSALKRMQMKPGIESATAEKTAPAE